MGEVGDEGDVVDEQLWGDDKDKAEKSKTEEKYEKDAPVQVSLTIPDCQMMSQPVVFLQLTSCMDCSAHAYQQH